MDLLGDKRSYDFIDIDLRRYLKFRVGVFSECRNGGWAVTYDNFIMHLIGIFNKRAFVLFRVGGFLKRNSELHYNFINPVFFQTGKYDRVSKITINIELKIF